MTMTTYDEIYLVMVVAAFLLFGTTLYIVTWLNRR